jgi:glucose/arabinose dehydrogenase
VKFRRSILHLSLLLSFIQLGLGGPVTLTPAFPNLKFDDNATASAVVPDGSQRVVVALQRGQVRTLPLDRAAEEAPLFLDLRDKLKEEKEFEEGLHGLAFHPQFAKLRRVFVCYSQSGPRRTVLSEFMVPEGEAFQADPRSERVILEVAHPQTTHWSGCIAFGPDGYLYVSIGDGGLRDDPYRMGQNMWALHGKILRIDVDGRSGGLAYGIPADNPFVKKPEVRAEIWAAGLRTPWGLSFDRQTKTMWCADVGQDRWEEVNLIKPGANYGWSEREGPQRFVSREKVPEEGGPFTDPVYAYPHSDGISITGGYVYRGHRLPVLHGQYLFGDWGVGKLWSMGWDAGTGESTGVQLLYAKGADFPGFNPTVIGHDARGEPLIFSHYPSVIFTLDEPDVLASGDTENEASDDSVPPPDIEPKSEVEEQGGEVSI